MLEDYNIKVIYEDNHLLCVVKPPGTLSQGDRSNSSDMLSLLKAYIKGKYNKPGDVFLGLVHRLDRPVGGAMVFGRTSKAAARLSEQIRERAFVKIYYAVLKGEMPEDSGALSNIIVKDGGANKVSVLPINGKHGGTVATLEYERAEVKEGLTLVRVNLITGRPHQIRAQFAYHGYPVLGDRKYKGLAKGRTTGRHELAADWYDQAASQHEWAADRRIKVENPALWAKKIEFSHPITKERMIVEAELPICYPWRLFTEAVSRASLV